MTRTSACRALTLVLLLWGVALVVSLTILAIQPAEAGSDRASLGALLGEARISAPPQPLPAPPFSVADLTGGTVDLERLRGRVVLLYFWTTW